MREEHAVRHPRSDEPILPPPPVPLELCNGRGERYCRLPVIESQLDELLALRTHHALTERITQSDRGSDGDVQAESLAYFLREWHREAHPAARDWLVEQTLDRIDRFIDNHLYGLRDADKEDAHGDVVARVFQAMFDLENPRGEYYQVRFWNALKARCIDRYDHYHRRAKEERANRVGNPHDRDGEDAEDPAGRVADATMHVADEVLDREEIRHAMQRLREIVPQDQLEAFVLRKAYQWPIEGTPGPTLSERFGKTPRTINNWIRAVETAIASAPEGKL